MKKIIINKIKCKKCGDIIESTHRHDLKICKCGAVAVDGGVISDNTIKNKSLYSGRNKEDEIKRKKVRKEVVPTIVIDFFANFN